MVCLKLYEFKLDQHLDNIGKGQKREKHYGMFCSQQCMIEYCRIVVKSTKTSHLIASCQMSFQEERRNGKGTGVLTPVSATKGQPARKGRHGRQLAQRIN